MRTAVYIVAAVLYTTCLAGSQPISVPHPFSITLLPGYQQQSGRSLDSTVGTVWKEGGLKIEYDVAGVWTDCKTCGWTDGEVWRKTQYVNHQKMVVVFTKSKRLVVSFPDSQANFHATIRNESDIADVLLMLSTFRKPSNSTEE